MTTMQVPGGTMAWREAGAGETVVLVHGTPSSSSEWQAVITALAPTFRVLAPDHLGFGESQRLTELSVYSLPWHAANFAAWLAAQQPSGRVHLVVHDFGGPIALPWVLDNLDRVASLTIVQSWAWTFLEDATFKKNMRFVDTWLMRWLYRSWNFSAKQMVKMSWGTHRPLDRALHQQFIGQFPTKDSRAGTWGFARSLVRELDYFDALAAQLPSLRALPTLVVYGLADKMVKPLHFERWQRELPSARAVGLADVGHFPQVEAPELVVPPLVAHLTAHPASAATTTTQARAG